MASNGRTIALGNADIEVTDGTEIHGYTFPKATRLTEGRGNSFTAAVSQGAPTRRDSQPYQLYAIEDFGGGFGQVEANSVMGGAGQGGQPNRFFDGECWSLQGGKLMPLPARNLVYPTGSTSPFPDEIEMPRGCLPANNGNYLSGGVNKLFTSFVAQSTVTLSRLYILLASDTATAAFGITVSITDVNTLAVSTYVASFGAVESTGFKFYVLSLDTGVGAMVTGHTLNVTFSINSAFTVGAFGGLNNAIADALQPYMQSCVGGTNTSYKMWANNIYGVYQLSNAGAYQNIVLTSGPTNSGIFNADAPGTAERTFAAYTVISAVVVDNKLYASFSGATPRLDMWNAADASAVNVPTSTTTTLSFGTMTYHEGQIFGTNRGAATGIYKWDGLYPATNFSLIIVDGKIGKPATSGRNPINALRVYQGHLWVFKPEGVFRIFANPSTITAAEVPRILQVWDAGGLEHIDNGKFVCEHQGMLYFNVRNRLYQLGIGQGGQPVVQPMVPPFARGRYRTNPYITGITSDGVVLYVSYDNIGVQAFDGRGWHKVTDYYTAATIEGGRSGLSFLTNPGGATDLLFTGDGRGLVKLPLPNILTSYSTQIYQENQNKCMTFISSVVDMDLANVPKFFRSVALYGSSSGWNWKVVGSYYQSGDPSYRTLIEKTYNEGLARDKWVAPSTGITASTYKVITKLIDPATHLESATASPGIFTAADFQNAYQGTEKRASNDDVANPVSAVSMAFIVYGWRADGTVPAANTYIDVAYIEDIVIKYWATLEYLGTWQFTVDLQAVYKNREFKDPQSIAAAKADVLWLRDRIKKQTPTRWTFRWVGSTSKAETITIESPAYSPQWVGEGGTPIADNQWDVASGVSFRLVDTSGV